jgi:hypothetical protein
VTVNQRVSPDKLQQQLDQLRLQYSQLEEELAAARAVAAPPPLLGNLPPPPPAEEPAAQDGKGVGFSVPVGELGEAGPSRGGIGLGAGGVDLEGAVVRLLGTLTEGREGFRLLVRLVVERLKVGPGGARAAGRAGSMQAPTPRQVNAMADLSAIAVLVVGLAVMAAWELS